MASQLPGLSALTKPGLIPGFKVSKEIETHQTRQHFSSLQLSNFDQLTTIVPVAVAAALSTYLLTRYFSSQSSPKSRVNMSIDKDSPKVVHSFDMEDIGNKAVYCRCWRSKKFPYCDGAHTKHNEETGDNVGPLIIKKKNP
uniref:CDGSH iron-sulfur domain-containing protein 2 n=1 Tax=Cyprinus carpio carpio TaxID=630221 RepID=A0A8C1FLZ8_CYPCA